MTEKTSETKPKDATLGDVLTGNTTDDGKTETHNDEVVTETTETDDDSEDRGDEDTD